MSPEQSPQPTPLQPAEPPKSPAVPDDPLPAVSGQTITTNGMTPPANTPPMNRFKKLLPVVAIFLLVLGVGGYIFGVYLPNQPDAVWQNGLKNSGKALDHVVEEFTTEDKLQKLSKSQVTGTLEASGSGYDFKGSLKSSFDNTKSTTNLDFTSDTAATEQLDMTVDILSNLAEGKTYPDLYFRINGLANSGEQSLLTAFATYDNKWIHLSSDFFQQAYASEAKQQKSEPINSGDVAEFIKTVTQTTNEYLFTSDINKAVLENRKFIGKEVVDDTETYHYEVVVRKEQAIAYCTALTTRVADLAFTKKMYGNDTSAIGKLKENAEADCKNEVEKELKDGDTFDAWVNKKHKLMHKVRLYEPNDRTRYSEFGQLYKGKGKLSLFVASRDETKNEDMKFSLDMDAKSLVSTGNFTAKRGGDNSYDVKGTLEIRPAEAEVKVEIPTDAVPFEEIFSSLFGLDETTSQHDVQGWSKLFSDQDPSQ